VRGNTSSLLTTTSAISSELPIDAFRLSTTKNLVSSSAQEGLNGTLLSSIQLPKVERNHTAPLLPEGCAAEVEPAPALCSAAVIKQLRQIGALVSQIELGYKAKGARPMV